MIWSGKSNRESLLKGWTNHSKEVGREKVKESTRLGNLETVYASPGLNQNKENQETNGSAATGH